MASMKKPASFWDTSWTPCKLNQDSSLSLEKITSSFSAPITEEHAWAIVFECVKCLQGIVLQSKQQTSRRPRVFCVTNTQQILLHRDGRVHETTFLNDLDLKSESNFSYFYRSKSLSHMRQQIQFLRQFVPTSMSTLPCCCCYFWRDEPSISKLVVVCLLLEKRERERLQRRASSTPSHLVRFSWWAADFCCKVGKRATETWQLWAAQELKVVRTAFSIHTYIPNQRSRSFLELA